MTARRIRSAAVHPLEVAAMVVIAVGLTVASLLRYLPCTIPPPPGLARITQVTRWGCASDIGGMFSGRQLDSHIFPYSSAAPGFAGLPLGTPEYPSLTAIWIWLTALPANSPHGFLIATALTFIPVVGLTTVMLALTAGRRAWIFAGTPPLFLYALLNWDLLPVLCVSAVLLVELPLRDRLPPPTRAVISGILLGVGTALKLYPALLVAPLLLAYLLDASCAVRYRVRNAALAGVASVGVTLAANVPFLLTTPDAWWSVIRFQADRGIRSDTLSFWYYGLLPWSARDTPEVAHALNTAATVTTAIALLSVLTIGTVIGVRRKNMPWVQTAAAMVAMYMLCNKVDSLQYTLWLLPFFAVIRIRIGWVVAYLAADLATFLGYFRNLYLHSLGQADLSWATLLLYLGVGAHVILLPILAGTFLASTVASPTRRALHRDEPPATADQLEPRRAPDPS